MADLTKPPFQPAGAVKPSSIEVDIYDGDISAQRTLSINHGVDGNELVPVKATSDGALVVSPSSGIRIPPHDEQVIDEADPNNVTITYKLNGVDVAVKTISVSGTTTTISVA